ncbi:MAG: prevent-host-death protein [Gemmatimonadetes bacterium]|nr:prevent-host-death protein [Gemmatimonadota bacterium]
MAVKAVGIKKLKAQLSEYVRLARAGETILITDREEVVAQIGPARHRPPLAGSLDEILDQMADEGMLTRAGLPKGDWTWKTEGLGLPAGTAQKILDELREDRV